MGRKCAVPHCYTGYRKCTDKAALYKVPDDDFFLNKWQEAIAREDRPITPKDYVCDKHFKDEDILRKRIRKDVVEEYQRPRLKPDAIPSIFPDLPEFILKMTKKRRKLDLLVPNDLIDISVNSDDEKIDQNSIKEEPDGKEDVAEINNDEIEIKSENNDIPIPCSSFEEIEYDSSGAKLYNCNECSYKTKFAHNLRTHKVKHLSGEYAYMICEFCLNYKTKWETTYVNHMKSKHGIILKEYLKCPFCMFKTKDKNFLAKHCENEHEKAENVEKNFKCEFDGCSYLTESKELLNIHNLTHEKAQLGEGHSVRIFSCRECFFQSNCKGSLLSHVKSFHTSSNSEETATFSKNLDLDSNSVFSCKECYFQTSSKGALARHVKSAHIAGNIEENKNNLDINLQNVKKKLSNNYKFIPSNKVLKKDKLTLKCSRCPYKSCSKALLEKHLLKHQMLPLSTPQRFKTILLFCTKCSFTTFSESSLEDHQKYTLHCKECSYITKDKSEYIKHSLTHRNTSVEVVVRDTSQEGSSNNMKKNDLIGQDFCLVTIKEEHEDLYFKES